jgi:hypothetical protein
MAWQDDVQFLVANSTLSNREAQVAVLGQQYDSYQAIHEAIASADGEAPTPESLRSVRSRLKDRGLASAVTTPATLHSSLELTTVPTFPGETDSGESTVHVYVGSIGSGTSVTAMSHVHRLLSTGRADEAVVIDVLDDETHTAVTQHPNGRVVSPGPDEESFYDAVSTALTETGSTGHTVVIVDQAHILLRDYASEIANLIGEGNNTSLRLISQKLSELEELANDTAIDMFHLHQHSSDGGLEMVRDALNEASSYADGWSALPTPEPTVVVPHLDAPDPETNTPPGVCQVVPKSGEVTVLKNWLSDDEREWLNIYN